MRSCYRVGASTPHCGRSRAAQGERGRRDTGNNIEERVLMGERGREKEEMDWVIYLLDGEERKRSWRIASVVYKRGEKEREFCVTCESSRGLMGRCEKNRQSVKWSLSEFTE
jgi:hypothetical protein